MQNSILEVKNLTKKFGDFIAVNNISFSLKKGEVVGLLGPNGAGKTTIIHMLLGITLLDKGSISYFGRDFYSHREEILQRINFASAFNTLQGRISSYENLRVFASLYHVKNPDKKIHQLAKQFEIDDILKKRYWDLSAGQKTRANIVKSLINDPDLVLMDEPTASLDPDIADKTLTLIETLKTSSDISVLYTSHDMDEVSRICDRVIFINKGKIVAQDSPLNLTKKIGTATLQITFDGKKEQVERFLVEQKRIYTFITDYTVAIKAEEQDIPSLIFAISKENIWITDIEVKKPTLEDFFLHIARSSV